MGENATGKTSIVESIYYLAFGKSFRTNKDEEIINKNSTNHSFYIKGSFNDSETIEIGYDGANKLVKKSNNKVKTLSQLIGYFKIVLFSPEDIMLIKGDPKYRRKYMDTSISQIDGEYLKSLQKFKLALKERNEYLKMVDGDVEKLNNEYFEAITKAYIDACVIVEKKREEFIKKINDFSSKICSKISSEEDTLNITYFPDVNVDKYWITFKEKLMIDIYSKTTTWGAARDDFKVAINDALAVDSASQGQIRTACLSLKLAVVDYYKEVSDKIIIILDDVLSELDKNRQNKIVETLDRESQTFITTTSINLLSEKALDNSEIIEIRRGEYHG